ncbi:MAG: phage tail protein I [Chloroflexales bacterium]|nr:phage tail protein I [Chloroflexales bacterium]
MTVTGGRRASSYLQYLPMIFQEGDVESGGFAGRFLLAFEQILTGLGASAPPGAPPSLAELLGGIDDAQGRRRLAGIERFFTPGPGLESPDASMRAPHEFLGWLARWVALTLRADWEEHEQRRFLARVVQLYRLRGTRAGLVEMIKAYTGDLPVTIYEFDDLPHYFQVELALQAPGADMLKRRQQVVRAIIDAEKPAHTYYALTFTGIPTIRVGASRLGIDTLLGGIPSDATPLPTRSKRRKS